MKKIKVLMLHVGDPVNENNLRSDENYIKAVCLNDLQEHMYLKKDIVNAFQQMKSLSKNGVDIKYGFWTNRKSIKDLLNAGHKIKKLIKDENPDLVHVFWGASSSLITVMYSSKPVVISFSGSDLLGSVNSSGKYNLSGNISRIMSLVSAMFAKKIITKSEHMKTKLWKNTQKKVTVIPNGVELSQFYVIDKNEAREFLGLDKKKKIIIFFNGSGAYVKNQPLAEETFKLIKNKVPESELMILKDIPHNKLLYYYNAADLMLLTSFHEGSNNSVKEAMACNLPIVSVNCGDTKERLEGVTNTSVVMDYKAELLAEESINILLKNERSDSRKKINEVSMQTIADKITNLYKTVLR
jgi:teichuronic acid biosynthesis glycosyltransferase TuaC